jgi:HK97 family phage prohead protease
MLAQLETREAVFDAASSFDPQSRTIKAILAAGAAVPRRDERGAFLEVLAPEGMKAADNVPLLDAHRRGSLQDILGKAEDIRAVDNKIEATLLLTQRAVDLYAEDIRSRIITGTSIGYSVERWKEATIDGQRVKRAVEWTLHEASLVPVPSDPGATLRSETVQEQMTRASINSQIRSIAKACGLSRDWADAEIDAEAGIDTARTDAIAAMQARSAQTRVIATATVGPNYDNAEAVQEAMVDALLARMNPAHRPSEFARAYAGQHIASLSRELLRLRGISTMGLSDATVIERQLAGSYSTSDLPILLQDTMNKYLRQVYQAAPSGVKLLATGVTNRDFRLRHSINVGGPYGLDVVNESGEFKALGSLIDAEETYKLLTYGLVFGVTRQMLINDDLGMLNDLTRRLALAAQEKEASLLAGLVTSNPVMKDTHAVFSTQHANIAASGAAISDTTLAAARLALRTQRGLAGEPISVTPKYLLVGPTTEHAATKQVATVAATTTEAVNTFVNLGVIVDPRITTNGWYMVASPSEIPGLEYAHLEGAQGPEVISRMGFERDCVEFRVRDDYGTEWIDWRGWFYNPGA